MLELLVNEDKDAAEALFHEIVVEKSRDIYESLLEDDAEIEEETDEEVDEATDEEVDESDEDLDEADDKDDDDEEMDEGFDLDSFEVEADDDMGGDPMDDMMSDMGDEGDEEEGEGEEDEGDMEDRVEDLEDALDDLKAEFEKMMAGEEGDEEADDMDMDDGEEAEEESLYFGEDEEVDEATDEEVDEAEEETDESEKSEAEQMREYVEKVSGGGLDAQGGAKMGDNGANAKSPVAGKNDMGGTASNLNQGKDNEAGDHAGLGDMNAKEEDAGNVNKPGGKAGKSNKAMPKGHGAEKKGSGETADKGAGSPINGVSTRAK